jgi:rod shape-determining protein MreC
LGLGLFSLVLMFADSRFDYLTRVRYFAALLVTPVHYVAAIPVRVSDYIAGSFKSRNDLIDENQALKEQLLLEQFQLQKLEHLTAENHRLNELLKASSDVEQVVVRAQLTGESPDPFSKRVLINKGSADNVHIGQPVLDAFGLMGQVVEVGYRNSWVLLISDPQHATPVQINRNGIRSIAAGTRDSLHSLTLNNIPNTSDIQVGDLLVTSGLDQHFPVGYPVGIVNSVTMDPGKPFAEVLVTPTAHIDRSRNLLLLFGNKPEARVATPVVSATVPVVSQVTLEIPAGGSIVQPESAGADAEVGEALPQITAPEATGSADTLNAGIPVTGGQQ